MEYCNQFILIAKCNQSSISGPAGVVRELINHFPDANENMVPILLSEEETEKTFVLKTVKMILRAKNCIVNVHTDGFLIPLLVYLLSYGNKKNTYYLTVHGIYRIDSQTVGGKQKVFYCFLERLLYRHFPNLICVSEMLRQDIVRYFRRTRNVSVIPNGSDAHSDAIWLPQKDRLEIVSLGGLRICKGIEEVLALFAFLKQKGIAFCGSVYGAEDGNLNWFRKEIAKRDLADCVTYCGILKDRQEVYDLISQADFQLCLSRYDTFNVAIAESLVLGCPCIVTDKCGASYLLENTEAGLVVNLTDENKFDRVFDYIMSFCSGSEKREKIIAQSGEFRELLSWSSVCQQYSDLGKRNDSHESCTY